MIRCAQYRIGCLLETAMILPEITSYNQFNKEISFSASKVITNYLKSLAKKEFTIRDTLKVPELLKKTVFGDSYKDISHHV